jgi:hemolysin III
MGVVLSLFALVLFIIKSFSQSNITDIVSNFVFSFSLLILYVASTKYHHQVDTNKRVRLKVFDHCAIYILIAGTYTPYALSVITGPDGWALFIISWSLALLGITLKVFFTGRFKILSTLMYVAMGWLAIFFIKPLMLNLSSDGLFWLFAGGVSYTVGALIYSIKRIPLNHAIFHLFVLLGSIFHFISIYNL